MEKFREIYRFEFWSNVYRVQTWLFFCTLAIFSFLFIRGNYIHDARNGDFLLNSPYVIASVTVMGTLIWLLVAGAIAGHSATRDISRRIHPLVFSAPIHKGAYLSGKLLAAGTMNAIILLAVPAGILLGLHLPGIESEIFGPSRPLAYLTSYFFIALPSGIAVTAIQFTAATLLRKGIASYIVSLFLFLTAFIVAGGIAGPLGMRELGKLLDPIGVVGIITELSNSWSIAEKNTQLIGMSGSFLWNRLFWLTIATSSFTILYNKFQLSHPEQKDWQYLQKWIRKKHTQSAESPTNNQAALPKLSLSYGVITHLRQLLHQAWYSFKEIFWSWLGIPIVVGTAVLVIIALPANMKLMSVPLFPRAAYILTFLSSPISDIRSPWIIITILTILYVGQVVWRERDAGIHPIANSMPVPEWSQFFGKYLGVSLMLGSWMFVLALAGIIVQTRMTDASLEISTFLQVMLGFQLPNYLLFALLVQVIHVFVNQKYIGHLASFSVLGLIAFAPSLGVEHQLLVFGSDPGWTYTDMLGIGSFLKSWLLYKIYWSAWASLLALTAILFWVRGNETGIRERFNLAIRRLTRYKKIGITAAFSLVMMTGGFIFYNTNLLSEYTSDADLLRKRAQYELMYQDYESTPDPHLSHTKLLIDIYPRESKAKVYGTFRLINENPVALDSISLSLPFNNGVYSIDFDRPIKQKLVDHDLGFHVYELDSPLSVGDSLQMHFEVSITSDVFNNNNAALPITSNSTYFTNSDWFPAIGYQWNRELRDIGERKKYGLESKTILPSPSTIDEKKYLSRVEFSSLDITVSTSSKKTAVAPGRLLDSWEKNDRLFFHYVMDVPIPNQYAIYSAHYVIREDYWKNTLSTTDDSVSIQIFHHPKHTLTLDKMIQSSKLALDYFSETFGSYPYQFLRFVERPGHNMGMHAEAAIIDYQEGFSLLNPSAESPSLDLPFYVAAHEVAHQWWGAAQVLPAKAVGAGLLVESPAVYYGMNVLEKAYGSEHLNRYLSELRKALEVPRNPAMAPLLESNTPFLSYRKGPLAMYTMSKYIGEEKIDLAMKNLFERFNSKNPPIVTSIDMYNELQSVTPDSLQYLLNDLFATNTFWKLKTEKATSTKIGKNIWKIELKLYSEKICMDSLGIESKIEMNDWVEIGVFSNDNDKRNPSYLAKHRIQSGKQTITVYTSFNPSHAGIDPNYLLLDTKMEDNIKRVTKTE